MRGETIRNPIEMVQNYMKNPHVWGKMKGFLIKMHFPTHLGEFDAILNLILV
jgi:hypothetical protein